MKSIKEVINESTSSWEQATKVSHLLKEAKEFYGGDIPEDIINEINSGKFPDYIWENLQSHDYRKLKNQLTKYFGKDIEEYINQKDADEKDIFGIKVKDVKLIDNQKFQSILQFFNYFVREVRDDLYIIEPIYSTKMNDLVYNECNSIVYHFTDSKSAESILKKGLRIRGRNFENWKYPERVYVYAPGYYISRENKDLWLQDAMGVVDFSKGSLVVLKIDLHKAKGIDFYKDPAMPQHSVFTYHNIPKECITKLKFN